MIKSIPRFGRYSLKSQIQRRAKHNFTEKVFVQREETSGYMEESGGYTESRLNGVAHREDGPAVGCSDLCKTEDLCEYGLLVMGVGCAGVDRGRGRR